MILAVPDKAKRPRKRGMRREGPESRRNVGRMELLRGTCPSKAAESGPYFRRLLGNPELLDW